MKTTSLALGLVLLAATSAVALRAPDRLAPPDGLEAFDHAPLRGHVMMTAEVPQPRVAAYASLLAETGADWFVVWDQATGVPSRLFGRGLDVPGAVRDGRIAERHARGFLARHIDLLAPGADAADFVLVADDLTDGMRTLGFRQTHGGLVVLGGQVSFRYKHDRLFMIGSEALPDVAVSLPRRRARPELGRLFASTWIIRTEGAAATAGAVSAPVILPLVGDHGVLGYRVVTAVEVSAARPGSAWRVYTDAETGFAVARESTLRFATGGVTFNTPVRYPGSARQAYPAKDGNFTLNGAPVTSDEGGQVRWSAGPGLLTVAASGPLVAVKNQGGVDLTQDLVLTDGAVATWDEHDDEQKDAQVVAFIHARIAKDFARAHYNPTLAFLDTQQEVNVNINDQCNAFSDGSSINFFLSSKQCANTGRLPDVIYHEFGHSVHFHSIIDGVGAFDGAFSEGLADYNAANITGDTGMGRGFFYNDGALREIDPPDLEHIWPRDVGEIHYTGMIFSGAMWDLRKLLIAKYGETDGIAKADKLYYAAVQRAPNIPATYAEVLAADDDDGDLANGTPNACEINASFAQHGLRTLGVEVTPLAAEAVSPAGFPVAVTIKGLLASCPGDGVADAKLTYRLRNQHPADDQTLAMVADGDTWTATIPPELAGAVVKYHLTVDFVDGSTEEFPDNLADPLYEFYVGDVVPLYCTDFEEDPFAHGWSHGLSKGKPEAGADDWMWGPSLAGGAGDPGAAFSGTSVIGNDLGGGMRDGLYKADKTNYAEAPVVDTGHYSDVRIQFWRWLNVEDGHFDKATIYANGQSAWQNFDSDQGDNSATQHQDREWRFSDVPVSQYIDRGKLTVKFELASDGGLNFGGWTIDDYCVVAAAGSICGDDKLSGAEQCDEGARNSDTVADACRTNCRKAACGDGVVDAHEVCDDGNTIGGDGCNATCSDTQSTADCGCRVGQPAEAPRGLGVLALGLGLALVARRRQRR